MAFLLTFVITTFYSRRENVHHFFLGIEVASAHLVFLEHLLNLTNKSSGILWRQHFLQ